MLKITKAILLIICILWHIYAIYLLIKNMDNVLSDFEEIMLVITKIYWISLALGTLFMFCYKLV